MHLHDDPADRTRPRLSRPQLTRLNIAQRDLAEARAADLVGMESAALILLIERLRGTLDDAVRLVDELSR